MKTLTCAATRRRLDAYHDGELPLNEQVAVSAHLEWCIECARAAADFQTIGAALRLAAPGRAMLSADSTVCVSTSTVVNRMKAERALPLAERFNLMCEDLHFVYAGFGATVAAFVCVFSLFGMMRLRAAERPDSLAGIVSVMAMRLECEPVTEGTVACRTRFAERYHRSNESAEEEAVFALDAALVSQRRLATLTTPKASDHEAAAEQVKLIEDLMETVSRARLETSILAGVPWLVTDTTVWAGKSPAADQNLESATKKRA